MWQALEGRRVGGDGWCGVAGSRSMHCLPAKGTVPLLPSFPLLPALPPLPYLPAAYYLIHELGHACMQLKTMPDKTEDNVVSGSVKTDHSHSTTTHSHPCSFRRQTKRQKQTERSERNFRQGGMGRKERKRKGRRRRRRRFYHSYFLLHTTSSPIPVPMPC